MEGIFAMVMFWVGFYVSTLSHEHDWIKNTSPVCIEKEFGNEIVKKCYKVIEVKE